MALVNVKFKLPAQVKIDYKDYIDGVRMIEANHPIVSSDNDEGSALVRDYFNSYENLRNMIIKSRTEKTRKEVEKMLDYIDDHTEITTSNH